MKVLAKPCTSCPYRKDHPSGVWASEEYEKLRDYDRNRAFGTFLCHQTNANGIETVCRGWLSVARESIAVRLGISHGQFTPEQVYAECSVPLHASGNAAANAGQKKIKRPPANASAMIGRLERKGAGHV
jgi:Family of unknown function (DUF6283)